MIDKYTKIVLTVIAVALSAVAVQNAIQPAGAQLGVGCGSSRWEACHVEITNTPLEIYGRVLTN